MIQVPLNQFKYTLLLHTKYMSTKIYLQQYQPRLLNQTLKASQLASSIVQ